MADTPSAPVGAVENPAAGRSRRLHDLDALRGFAMLLGIALHTALGFLPGLWPVEDSTATWEGPYDDILFVIHGFRMPVFFLMSGFFTAMLWRRRGLGSLLRHRFRRVLLPLVIGLITVVPLINWLSEQAYLDQIGADTGDDIYALAFEGDVAAVEALLDQGGKFEVDMRAEPGGWTLLHVAAFTGNLEMAEALLERGADPAPLAPASENETPLGVAFYFGHESMADLLVASGGGDPLPDRTRWSDLPGWGEGAKYDDGHTDVSTWPEMHHLWFLWTLMWMVAGFALVAFILDRPDEGQSPEEDGPGWPRLVMWLMVPLTLIPQFLMGEAGAEPVFGPDTPGGLIPFPHVLAYYATFFTFGAIMYGRSGRDGRPLVDTLGRRWWLLLPISLLFVYPAGAVFTFLWRVWPVAAVLQVVFAWAMCFGLMGLFRRFLSGEVCGVRYLSDASYWLYVTHLPLVIVVGAAVRDWQFPSFLKFMLVNAVVLGVLLVAYQLFVRYTPIGTLLNGKKVRPGRAAGVTRIRTG